jgi:hypothetical protein
MWLDLRIEIDRTKQAKLIINGRELTVDQSEHGVTKLLGIKGEMWDNTLAGILAQELFGNVGDLMRLADETEFTDPWEVLTEDDADFVAGML